MAFYLRYSENIEKDIENGHSYHYTGLDKSDFKRKSEVAECLNIESSNVAYNKKVGQWVEELEGLCAFELESDNLDEAIEEAKDFRYNEVYNSEAMPFWNILDANYVGECPEGDLISVNKLLFSNK